MQALVTTRRLTVDVLDTNDNAPRFSRPTYSASVPENSEPGAVLTRLNATDVDVESAVQYRIANESSAAALLFAVDASSGVVTALVGLDRERAARHEFEVYAVDGGSPAALTATARVVVNVLDANDRAPVFARAAYDFSVAERLPAGAEVGTVRADDADAPPHNRFRYELVDDDERSTRHFSLNAETGLLTTRHELDRERRATYRMLATARDDADRSLVGSASVVVTVDDINDNPPVFVFPVARNRTARVATAGGHVRRWRRLTTVRATDADAGPNGRVTYAVVADQRDQNDVRSARRRDHYFRVNATSGDVFADRSFHVTPGSANATFRLTPASRWEGNRGSNIALVTDYSGVSTTYGRNTLEKSLDNDSTRQAYRMPSSGLNIVYCVRTER